MNKKIKEPFINIGTGVEYKITWYVKFLMKKLNVNLKIKYLRNRPDGMPRKCLDISLAKRYGWSSKYDLIKGFDLTYKDFIKNYAYKRN